MSAMKATEVCSTVCSCRLMIINKTDSGSEDETDTERPNSEQN